MRTRLILSAIVATLLIGGTVAVTTSRTMEEDQFDAPYQFAAGTIKQCGKNCTMRVNESMSFTAQGTANGTWTANSAPGASQIWTEFQVHSFSAVGQSPELGLVTLVSDDNRLLTSRIESNVAGAAFPATSTIRTHVIATVGRTRYRSMTPIEIQAVLQQSDWPHNNTAYTQVGTIQLERVDNPGEVAATLSKVATSMSALNNN